MTAGVGVTTSGGSPNALVEIQPGMWVQAVVLVDQNGQYIPAPGSVMTTLGDTLYENATPAPARLAGNTSATKEFLTQTGNGTISAAPAWGTIASGDIPASVALTGTPTSPTGTPGDASTQIATDAFVAAAVNAAVQGLSVKPSVQEATAAALPSNVYSNGSSGVGATLTGVATGTLTVDGILVALGDRVLVKNEAAGANNGIYTCTVAGALGVAYVLTRAADMDTAAQVPGAFAFVEQGTANAGAGFTVASEGPFTVGTTAIAWTQFSGAGEITAGTGLSKSGNTLSVTVPASPYATTALASPAASITFSAIPAGYSMLRLLVVGASAVAAESDRWAVTVNGDAGSHYDTQALYANNTSVTAAVRNAQADWFVSGSTPDGDMPGASATAGVAGILEVQIPAYAATVLQKTGLWRSGYSDAATSASDQTVTTAIAAWRSTVAITSITIATQSASNLAAGTTALLYLS